MKNFKKIMAMALAVSMVMAFAACGKTETPAKPTEKPAVTEPAKETETTTAPQAETEATPETDAVTPDSTEAVETAATETEKILRATFDQNKAEMMGIAVMPVDAERYAYFTGLEDGTNVAEASVLESMVGSMAYSMVVVKALPKDDANYVAPDALAEEMKAGIDTRKWICVEADDMDVAVNGDYVMLFMVASDFDENITSEKVLKSFTDMDLAAVVAADPVSIAGLDDVPAEEDVDVETEVETETADETASDGEAAESGAAITDAANAVTNAIESVEQTGDVVVETTTAASEG